MRVAQYTSRVGARAELARSIKASYLAEAEAAGLSAEDLDVLIVEGDKAKEADREQHAQITANQVERSATSKSAAELLGPSEGKIRDRLLLVINDVKKKDASLGEWLTRLSFARYRFQEHHVAAAKPADPAKPEAAPSAEQLKVVERVERQDIPTRLEGLGAFCQAILKPGREEIVKAFEARKLSAGEIKAIGEQADALARHGKNAPKAAEAGAREAAAVVAQREKWAEARRIVVKVAAAHGELAGLLGEC